MRRDAASTGLPTESSWRSRTRRRPTVFSIFLLSIETLEKRRLTFPPVEHQADVRPAFSPDGRSVAFARVGGTTKPGLFVVPVAGGEPRRVSLGDVWTGGVPTGSYLDA